MKRRAFISSLASASVLGISGCLGIGTGNESNSGGKTINEIELPVPESQLNRGAPRDAIPAITDPVFASDWSQVKTDITSSRGDDVTEPRLEDSDKVIGVERGDEARAYPLRILNWHEVVNDTLDGPLLVTYCPLCGSGVTAERRVEGEETTFGVSGLLWNSDLVMYDEKTNSLWSQILGKAIRGEMTGTELELVPSSFTTWEEWKKSYSDTKVLLPPPHSYTIAGDVSRNYDVNPYESYDSNRRIGIGHNDFDDDRLHPKTVVIGVVDPDTNTDWAVSRAYPINKVKKEGPVNDVVGDREVVVAVGPDDTLVAYDRTVDGGVIEFEKSDKSHIEGGGSRWRITTGEAVDGDYEWQKLERANERSPMFWFAWLDFHPETEVYDA